MAFTYEYVMTSSDNFQINNGEDHYNAWNKSANYVAVGQANNTGTTWVTEIPLSSFKNGSTVDSITNIGNITIEIPLRVNCNPVNCVAFITNTKFDVTSLTYENAANFAAFSSSSFYTDQECTIPVSDGEFTSNASGKKIYCRLPVYHLSSTPVYIYIYKHSSTSTGSIFGSFSNTKVYVHRKATYTVKLTADSGIYAVIGAGSYKEGSSVSISAIAKKGYAFSKWSDDDVNNPRSLTILQDYNLEATSTANTYSVSFDANEGSCGTASIDVTYNSTYGSLPLPTRSGYEFIGWYTEIDSGSQVTSESIVTITSNQTLYARWKTLATIYIKTDTWKASTPYVKVDGHWQKATAVYYKVGGVWKSSTRK